MQNMNLLSEQIQTMYGRVLDLYQRSNQSLISGTEVLPIALRELGLASEELQVAVEELTTQNEALALAQHEASTERLRYRTLFEFAPDAMLVTTPAGNIQEVNHAAATLLNRHALYLVGKPIASLVFLDDRVQFRTTLAHINHMNQVDNFRSPRDRAELTVRLYQRTHDRYVQDQRETGWFEARLTVEVIRNSEQKPLWLRWVIRDANSSKQATAAFTQAPKALLQQSYDLECYSRGETILLKPQMIWLVVQGVVKLSTLSERGEEILVGLAAEEQVFGASLTTLPTYQAIALSDVKLMAVSVSEVAQSPDLSQALLPRIVQRLQQTERFLAIRGHLHVQERLEQFLRLLKEEIGEPIEAGTRLRIRFTHQDIATACCTTRVTVTRLLGQLQQQGVMDVDRHNHVIVKDECLTN
jgi:PAS domain S-box-containing protein